LRNKSKVFKKFKDFKSLLENQIDNKIKAMRTNNGGELCGKDFEQFCKKCGIAYQNTTPYTPQQNGVSERMNKKLMDKERNMLSGARLAQEFLEEVVDTAKYMVSMSPSSVLVDWNPHEVWSSKNPSVSHL
jgi:transposase InsO family protein